MKPLRGIYFKERGNRKSLHYNPLIFVFVFMCMYVMFGLRLLFIAAFNIRY